MVYFQTFVFQALGEDEDLFEKVIVESTGVETSMEKDVHISPWELNWPKKTCFRVSEEKVGEIYLL